MSSPPIKPTPPPTRQISFLQLVQEADPNYQQGQQRPWIYEFSNGRLFYAVPNIYTYVGP